MIPTIKSVRVGSRFHLGLHQTELSSYARFGGLGFFIDEIETKLSVYENETNQVAFKVPVEGYPSEENTVAYLDWIDAQFGSRPSRISIDSAIPAHVGLGSRTAFFTGLAAAKLGLGNADALELSARHAGRGSTSALGIARIYHTGVVLDLGQRSSAQWLPSRFNANTSASGSWVSWNAPWSVLVVTPKVTNLIEGDTERAIFEANLPQSEMTSALVAANVLFEMLPALNPPNYAQFGRAVRAHQHLGFKSIEWSVQAKLVREFAANIQNIEGVHGVGLSSMGPTLGVFHDDPKFLASRVEALAEEMLVSLEICKVANIAQAPALRTS